MKRKVKFQEGGPVGAGVTAAERRRATMERLNSRRAVEDFNRREQSGQLDERTMRRAGGTPVASEVADFDRRLRSGQLDADTMRRMGGTPSGSGESLRSGAGMTPSSGSSPMSRMAPRAGGILGLLGLAPLPGMMYRAVRDRERPQEDLDVAEAYRTGRDVREIQSQRAAREGRGAFAGETSDGMGEMAAPAPAPAPAPQPSPARTQPTRRAAAPARRQASGSDDLNAMVLRLQGGSPPQTETERRLADRMGIAYRKGGLVNKYQAGGRVSNISELSDAELNRLGYAAQAAGSTRGVAKTQLESHRRRRDFDQEATKRNAFEDETMRELEESLGRGENAAAFMNEIVRSGGGMKQRKVATYKKGGLVKPKKFQAGGPVKVPGKTPASGGPKPPARMRDRISSEDRKELDAPLTQAEKNRMSASGFKKGGKIMTKKMKTGGKVPGKLGQRARLAQTLGKMNKKKK